MLARHDAAIEKHDVAMASHDLAIARHDAAMARHDAAMEKHEAAIRDLIVVSRTLLDSHQRTAIEMRELRESLHILIDTVDRIIRKREG
jgi:soluble cytochrome b562